MSKTSDAKNSERRRREKFARKQAKKALYESYAKAGANSKSKRNKQKSKKNLVSGVDHPDGECGNPGCKKCYGVNFAPFIKNGQPHQMPQWMWQRWKKAA